MIGKIFKMDVNEFWSFVERGYNKNQIAKLKNVQRQTITAWMKRNDINYKFQRIKDLTGQRFERLLVVESKGLNKDNKMTWLCKCDCGNLITAIGCKLSSGEIKSCGCLAKDILIQRNINRSNLKGASVRDETKRISRIYMAMKRRCYKETNSDYKYYGGRGIKICDEWLDKENGFLNFYNWAIENGYNDELTIERKDVDGNYEPNNCTWATMKEQANNTRKNHFIEINNEIKTIAQWTDETGINYGTFSSRIKNNDNDLLNTKNKKVIYITINGVEKSIPEWAKEYNIREKTLYQRYKKLGWTGEKLLQQMKPNQVRCKNE